MRRGLLITLGAVVTAGGATAAILAIPGGTPAPVTTTAAGCTIQPGTLPPGRYTGTAPISRHSEAQRDGGAGLGPIRDELTDTGSMAIDVAVAGRTISGTWGLDNRLTTTITRLQAPKPWVTPGVMQVAGGTVTGTAAQLHLTGGNGHATHYPGGGIVTRYPIADGVATYAPYGITERLDIVVTIDSVSCDGLRGSVLYPIGLSMRDTAREPQPWVARRTAAPCDDEPSIVVTEQLNRVEATSATDFKNKALAAGQPAGRTETAPQQRSWEPDNGPVTRANLVIPVTVRRPVWQPAPGATIPADDVKLLDRIVDMIRAHEAKHVANVEAAARRYVCETHGRSPADAKRVLDETMICEIVKAQRALDRIEGRLVTELDATGKPVDAKYVPETDESRLTPLPGAFCR
jgi:hypothetical protein